MKLTLRDAVSLGLQKPYWVEADRAVKDHDKIIGYSVWHFSKADGREKVHVFSSHRTGGASVALHLANMMRDDLNSGLE